MWQLTIQYKHKILVKICASSTDIQGYLRRAFPLRQTSFGRETKGSYRPGADGGGRRYITLVGTIITCLAL